MQWIVSGGRWKHDPGAERDLRAFHVRETAALDDVPDLVVGVAVVRCPAGLDEADELRRVEAAGFLVDEVAERPLVVGTQLGLLVEPNRDAALRPRAVLAGRRDRDDDKLVRAWVVDRIPLARAQVSARVRSERVRASIELERAGSGGDVEQLVTVGLAPFERPAGREADDALLEDLTPFGGADRRLLEGGVAVRAPSRDRVLVDHERVRHPAITPAGLCRVNGTESGRGQTL